MRDIREIKHEIKFWKNTEKQNNKYIKQLKGLQQDSVISYHKWPRKDSLNGIKQTELMIKRRLTFKEKIKNKLQNLGSLFC